MMDDEELDAVIAHECGHILCRHVLYHSVAEYLLSGADALGILGSLAAPIKFAIWYWYRKSELSCDRCASIVTSPEIVARTMARLAGGPKAITNNINMAEWAQQADKYDEIYNDGLWNKTLQISVTMAQSHPFSAVRVREIFKWGNSSQYRNLINNPHTANTTESGRCPHCGRLINPNWTYCKFCKGSL